MGEVQQALHAKVGTKWSACGGVLYSKNVGSLIPYLNQIFQLGPDMRVLYYSGDIDIATVPFAGTQRCLNTLNRPLKEKWRSWVINKEVSGYVEVYDKYTYATVKGAGHETPAYQPWAAYVMFTSFLNNQSFPAA